MKREEGIVKGLGVVDKSGSGITKNIIPLGRVSGGGSSSKVVGDVVVVPGAIDGGGGSQVRPIVDAKAIAVDFRVLGAKLFQGLGLSDTGKGGRFAIGFNGVSYLDKEGQVSLIGVGDRRIGSQLTLPIPRHPKA